MLLIRSVGLLILCFLGLALVRAPAPEATVPYLDDPPPAHTGGFDEPTCHQCHFGESLNASGGSLELEGVPETYTPGERYRIVVRLEKDNMQRAGFQLASRFAEGEAAGEQAGTLEPADSARAMVTARGNVQYVHHTADGTALSDEGRTKWTVKWTAPDDAEKPVAFHAAANAANDDASEFGDFVYTSEAQSNKSN